MATKPVKVYGASDDCIELEGAIQDEFSAYDTAKELTFNDGTVLRVEYSPKGYEGKWKVERVKEGTAAYTHVPAPDDEDDYSDVVTLTGDIKSVKCRKPGPLSFGDLLDEIDGIEWKEQTSETLQKVLDLIDG